MYETMLFIHILSIIIWLGGSIMLTILLARAEKAGDGNVERALGAQSTFVSMAIFMPMAIIALLSGAFLVNDSGAWGWGDPWVSIGFTAIIVAMLAGPLVLKPTGEKLGIAVAEHGPTSDEAMALKQRLKIVSTFVTLLLIVTVWAMVAKPGM